MMLYIKILEVSIILVNTVYHIVNLVERASD